MRNILVATDGSEGAGRAIDFAAELTRATGATLHILTVGGNMFVEDISRLARAEGDVGAALDAPSNSILKEAELRARRVGTQMIQSEVSWGDAAEAIIAGARRHGADAIVLGRRGLGRLTGLLIGSVSQKVVSLAPCTTIIVP